MLGVGTKSRRAGCALAPDLTSTVSFFRPLRCQWHDCSVDGFSADSERDIVAFTCTMFDLNRVGRAAEYGRSFEGSHDQPARCWYSVATTRRVAQETLDVF